MLVSPTRVESTVVYEMGRSLGAKAARCLAQDNVKNTKKVGTICIRRIDVFERRSTNFAVRNLSAAWHDLLPVIDGRDDSVVEIGPSR